MSKRYFRNPYILSNILISLAFILTLLLPYRMENYVVSFTVLSALSLVCLIIATVMFINNLINRSGQSLKSNMISPILYLFVSIWIIRFNIGIHTDLYNVLNTFEHIFNSLVHALQSFSMDEDYTDFITSGKDFITNNMSSQLPLKIIADAYGGYCALLNFLAPVAGGAILFDILTNIYPLIRLRMNLFFHPNTFSHIFSELNLHSLTLAQSVHEKYPKDFIIFTDVYQGNDCEEENTELVLAAKQIGALCLKTDLGILKEVAWGPVNYYLLDENQNGSIEALAHLSDTQIGNPKDTTFFDIWSKGNSYVNIYVFADSSFSDHMIENFNHLCKEYKIERKSMDGKVTGVTAKPINTAELLSYRLVHDFPLYRCIMESPAPANKEEMKILLIGDSPLTRHFIKTSYWCGQMLNPYCFSDNPKRVLPDFHIICPDTTEIKNYIASSMPAVSREISEKDSSFPYAHFHFVDQEINYINISSLVEEMKTIDYCIISTGNDLENINICSITKKSLDQAYLLSRQNCDLLCYVENPQMNHVTNRLNSSRTDSRDHIRVNYIGNLNDQLDYSSIQKTALEEETAWVKQAYKYGPLYELYSNLYEYRSSLASALHYNYRLFSMGIFTGANEDYASCDYEEYRFSLAFLEKLIGISFDDLHSDPCLNYKQAQQKRLNNLFWLEKIRWNSFVKSYGYEIPRLSEVRNFYDITGKFTLHKSSDVNKKGLFLHACIMDLDKPIGIVLDKIRNKDSFENMKDEMMDSFLHDSFPEETNFPEFLQYLLEKHFDEENTVDILDILSILVGGDYKDYDLQQIPIFTISRIIRNMEADQQIRYKDYILRYLQLMIDSDCYLSGQFTHILNTVKKINHSES